MRVRVLKRGIPQPGTIVVLSLSSEPPRNVSLLHAPLGLKMNHGSHPGLSCDRRDSIFDDS